MKASDLRGEVAVALPELTALQKFCASLRYLHVFRTITGDLLVNDEAAETSDVHSQEQVQLSWPTGGY